MKDEENKGVGIRFPDESTSPKERMPLTGPASLLLGVHRLPSRPGNRSLSVPATWI